MRPRLKWGHVGCRPITSCHWSPAGHNILLAGLDSNAGTLEFFNVDDMATLRTQAHFLCNNVKWDQTGRFVCTWVDDARDMEHGYVMWSFTGEMLYRCVALQVCVRLCWHIGLHKTVASSTATSPANVRCARRNRYDTFFGFSWRPRPPRALPAETERHIVKSLRTYAKKYDEQDEQLLAAADTEQQAARQQKRADWEAFLASKADWLQQQRAALASFLGHEPEEPASSLQEVAVQQIVDVKEEPFQP